MIGKKAARRLETIALTLLAAAALGYLIRMKPPGRTRGGAPSPAHAVEAARRSAGAHADGAQPSVIRVGWTAWADAEIVTHLVKRLLEERLGYRVDLVMADIGLQYQGVAQGDLDLMLMAWLPVTHADYWTRFSVALTNLGPIYTRARLGWAVPNRIPKAHLQSIEDLRRPLVRRRLRKMIHGIDPGSGLMRASERALRAYGLEYELIHASGAAMAASLSRAIDRDEWIVVTAWNPHWIFSAFELRYLEDPKGVLGGWERVHALVRAGFDQDFPAEVTELLTRMFIPIPELEAALRTATEVSVEAAVDDFLRLREDRIAYWLTGEAPPPLSFGEGKHEPRIEVTSKRAESREELPFGL